MSDHNINLLVALRALLEEANVTRAGERLSMGQSRMSAALSRLRETFGDELLVRVGRDYELTPLAWELLPQVQATIPLVERALGLEETFDPSQSDRTFSIRVSDFAAIELKQLFRRYAAATRANLDIRGLPSDSMSTDRVLLANDFLIAPSDIGIAGPGMELFRDTFIVIADRNHPLAGRDHMSLDDFSRYPHARCDFGLSQYTAVERRLFELGALPEYRVTTSTLTGLPPVIAGTDLLAVVPHRVINLLGEATGTVALPTPFPTIELVEFLWWHPSREHDPAHRWFRDLAAEVVASGALNR